MRNSFVSAVILSCFAISGTAAPVGQATTPSTGAFAGACAGLGFYSTPWPGEVWNNGASDSSVTCSTSTSSGLGTAATAISNPGNGTTWTNNASATATQGQIHVVANNVGAANIYFPGADANAGWNEMITLGNGSGSGIWDIPIIVQNSSLTSVGSGASASASIAVYKNGSLVDGFLSTEGSKFMAANSSHNGTIYSSWTAQMVAWGSTNWGPTDPASTNGLSVPFTVVHFFVPYTYGVAFELGIYMNVEAGERAYGGDATPNSSSSDFSHSAYWGGKNVVFDSSGLNPTSNFTVTSGSGFDYTSAVVPEPSGWMLSGAGTALLFAAAMRRRRQAQ